MLDIMDMNRRIYQHTYCKQTSIQKKAIADYKRISGDVSCIEQIFLDKDYIEKVPSISKIENSVFDKIGTIINIAV